MRKTNLQRRAGCSARPPGHGACTGRVLRRAARGAILALACVVVLFARPAAGQELARRHLETQLNTEFRSTGVPFHQYVNHLRTVIDKTRVDLTPERRLQIIDANSPFEWRPPGRECRRAGGGPRYRNGVLLIHGLTDSPYQMRDLARFFQARCFLVRAIVLPGHGTVPGDLLSVQYDAWIQATKFGVDSFLSPREVERLFIAGFSTGGTLALFEAMQNDLVSGVLLFSPAVKIKSKMGFMANWHKTISWASTGKQWLDVAADEDYAKYESFPFNAADQIYLLTGRLEREKEKLGVKFPLFMALSEDDDTVDASDSIAFFKEQRHPLSRMVLYTNRRADDGDARIQRRPSAYPGLGILDFSHLAIHIAPDNPHYGRNGDYHYCLHYLGDAAKMDACKRGGDSVRYGEKTEANLEQHLLRRLTYNPDFEHLTQEVASFLERVP